MSQENASDRVDAEEQSRLMRREEIQSVQGYIAIKGTRNGLLLTLEPETPFSDLINALAARLAEAPSFFQGASLSVDTSQRMLRVNERIQLENLLAHYHMSVAPLEQQRPERPERPAPGVYKPNEAVPSMVLSVQEDESPATTRLLNDETSAQRDLRETHDTLFIRRTVRSGQAIHHASNVIVMGDVNNGAEIVAGGDIIVWGVLRGMVHAGYPDNENALVCSLVLAPVQLRIAHLLSRPPEGAEVQPRPEVASIKNGRIVVETWVSGRPPRKS